jgi:hypothetical protein
LLLAGKLICKGKGQPAQILRSLPEGRESRMLGCRFVELLMTLGPVTKTETKIDRL